MFPNDIIIEGHTDPTPVRGGAYRSNWELSIARAVGVVNFFTASGIDPEADGGRRIRRVPPGLSQRFRDEPGAEPAHRDHAGPPAEERQLMSVLKKFVEYTEEHMEETELWMLPYSTLMLTLVILFIMFYAFSSLPVGGI